MRRSLESAACGLIVSCGLLVPALSYALQNHPPDNTAVNKTDRGQAPSADQAKNNLSDRELMRHIRQDVVKDKSLSTYGHNVKIIAEHGKVTLKGPVHSDEEKRAIEEHARRYAHDGNVDNQLSVKGDK